MAEIFPISYWGSIYYFQEIARHKSVCIEVFETYPKQTHRNRLAIVSANGELILTSPVFKPNGTKTLTKDIELIADKATLQKNWRAVTSAYASSPFFDHYEKELKELFLYPNKNLVQHCLEINSFLLGCWGIETTFSLTNSYDWRIRSANLDIDFMDKSILDLQKYQQVQFQKEQKFVPNTSALDLLCNLGPLGRNKILPINH